MLTVFGIRHHGTGSASSLRNALAELQPDCILVEGPPDAGSDLIEYVVNDNLIPPIALLVYNPSNLKQAAYYPFAHFSPEWQAMKYGVANNIPTSFMDLPRTLAFSLDIKEKKEGQKIIRFEQAGEAATKEEKKIAKDPLGYIAKLAGYEDSERWWDITFERANNPSEIFQSILILMGELRASVKETPLRELNG